MELSDKIQSGDIDAYHDYASAQCSRMVLNEAGIAGGWKVEYMPEPRGKLSKGNSCSVMLISISF